MKIRRLLVVPLLAPVLAVVLVAALNPGPRLGFRLLIWQTPAAPLGLWLAAAGLGGAALSGGAAGLALRQGTGRPKRQSLRGGDREREPWLREEAAEEPWRDMDTGPRPGWRHRGPPELEDPPWMGSAGAGPAAPTVSVAPARAPGEPAPTVVVPFRVLRRPDSDAADAAAPIPMPRAQPAAASSRTAVAVAAIDDWGDTAKGEDW
ncbi:MAG: hypothetical protein VKO39_00990 [Cyanobacteriota bacterium]|nr:hypothetical protein [Cyanobacteriota bacterium]